MLVTPDLILPPVDIQSAVSAPCSGFPSPLRPNSGHLVPGLGTSPAVTLAVATEKSAGTGPPPPRFNSTILPASSTLLTSGFFTSSRSFVSSTKYYRYNYLVIAAFDVRSNPPAQSWALLLHQPILVRHWSRRSRQANLNIEQRGPNFTFTILRL